MRPKLEPPTSDEDAAIQRGIAADPDNPGWTEADFAGCRGRADRAAFDPLMTRPGGEPPRAGDELPLPDERP